MDNDDKNTIKEIAKTYPNIVKRTYKDGASGAVKQVGALATDLVKGARFILAPVQYMAHFQDRLEAYFERVSNSIPEDQQVPPSPSLLLPLLEKLKYQDEQDILTSLYIELLTRACDKERVNEAHPAFINIIPQLSSDEAKIIFHFSGRGQNPGKYFIALKKGALNKVMSHIPLSEVDQPSSVKSGYTLQSSAMTSNLFPLDSLVVPEYVDLYLSHLKSLNIIELQKSPGIINFHRTKKEVESGRLQKKDLIHYKLTLFGELFAQACIPEEFDLTRSSSGYSR